MDDPDYLLLNDNNEFVIDKVKLLYNNNIEKYMIKFNNHLNSLHSRLYPILLSINSFRLNLIK
jgi:hypothetical protein